MDAAVRMADTYYVGGQQVAGTALPKTRPGAQAETSKSEEPEVDEKGAPPETRKKK